MEPAQTRKKRNALTALLYNVSDATVGVRGAGLDPARPIDLRLYLSGPANFRLYGDFPEGTRVTCGKGKLPYSLEGSLLSIWVEKPRDCQVRVLPG